MERIYDVAILGGGPAGCTAAIYTAGAGFSTLILEKAAVGGQMTQTAQIINYPGFPEGIDGVTLGEKMRAGAERSGARVQYAQVLRAALWDDVKTLETDGGSIRSRAVILATGADHRHLGLRDEEALTGRGVAYCAACDGMFYRGKTVAVVGGGNSAAADALLLSKIAGRVILIHRRDTLRAAFSYHAPLSSAGNVEFCWNSAVTELLHDEKLTGVRLRDVNTAAERELALDGLFISIGRTPATGLFRGQLRLDRSGYILADPSAKTDLPGVFAAGDACAKEVRQIVTATADGAIAAHSAQLYLTGSI